MAKIMINGYVIGVKKVSEINIKELEKAGFKVIVK